jgi:hypothetical protein
MMCGMNSPVTPLQMQPVSTLVRVSAGIFASHAPALGRKLNVNIQSSKRGVSLLDDGQGGS